MILFTRVAESRSFSAAARELGHTPSAVSRQVAQLEDRIGVKLLHRNTTGLTLTAEGRAYFERCAEIRDRIADAETFAASMTEKPRGILHVSATVAFAKAQLLPVLPDFMERHDELKLALELSDRPVDLSRDEIDVAIRFTEQIEDGSLIARKLMPNERVICAAPGYLAKHGTPGSFDDLNHHNCLQLSTVESWNNWMDEPGERGDRQKLSGNFSASSADGIYHATLAGLGIARLSLYLVENDLKSGRLVRILPDYLDQGSNVVAVYASKRNLPPRIRSFVDFLTNTFRNH